MYQGLRDDHVIERCRPIPYSCYMGKCRNHRVHQGGFSLLLEVMVGLGIFLIAFLMVYGVFPMSQRSLAEGRNQMVANSIAREFLEAERDKTLATVAQGKGNIVVTDTRSGQHQVEGRQSHVDYEVTVTGSDGSVPGTRLVQVVVAWNYGGLAHRTRMETVVGGGLPQ